MRQIKGHQRRDGSFGGLAATIRGLFALHLLERERTPESDRALDWLWETGLPPQPMLSGPDGAVYHDLLFRMKRGEGATLNRDGAGPFVRGCSRFLKTAAGIFLASVFGRGRERRVLRSLQCLDGIVEARGGLWCSPSCSSNLLRAYTLHPDASRGRPLARAVRKLGRSQDARGVWPGMPFAPTFLALAHVDSRDAKAQVRRAIEFVKRTQNKDGTWGREPNREFTTYLIYTGIRRYES